MSTSSLLFGAGTGSGRPSWLQPISSALLDDLMSSSKNLAPKGEKNDGCTEKSEENTSKPKQDSLVFTPPQVHKAKRKRIEINNDEETPQARKPRLSISFSGESTQSHNSSVSSVYVTPENASNVHPISTSTPDFASRRRLTAKRSLGDDYRRTPTPGQTSYNSSYYSPNISLTPSDTDSPRRRPKPRWSNGCSSPWTDTSICSADVSGGGREGVGGVEPLLVGYQLVGDSQFCRFGQKLLGLRRVPMANSPGRIGICVSGQTITDLHRRVKENMYPISDKIILMIGTNDFLRNVDVSRMCDELLSLIGTLRQSATSIVLLTLPPIPKIANKQHDHHFRQLDQYNNFIRSLDNGESVRIADVSPLYSSAPPYRRCRMDLFELYFYGNTRHDLIHLNQQGLEVIRSYILEHFMDT